MHLRCPDCENPVEVVEEALLTCSSCGSQLDLESEIETIGPVGARNVGHFQLLEHVGSGHFGDVWRAYDESLERTVALKIPRTGELDLRTVEIFLREARSAARLRHPHIVPVYEVGREEDLVYIVSEYIQGMTLAEFLETGRLPPPEAARLLVTVADALEHAHSAGVVHRDLKPGNIMIDGDKRPHLMDFGLAKRDAGEVSVSFNGKILGTPAYMSPEQARGEAHRADGRSDIYSLGVILYELLAGQRPFQGDARMLIHHVLYDEPQAPRSLDKSIPRELETICLKAMSKAPEARYATAREFSDDLLRYLRGEPILARRPSRLVRTWKLVHRNKLATAAGLAIVVLLGAFGFLLSERRALSARRRVAGLQTVVITTNPPGARGVMAPLGPNGVPDGTRRVRFKRPTPVEVDVPPGQYLVVVKIPGFGFHEVYRTVPQSEAQLHGPIEHAHQTWAFDSGNVILPEIRILSDSEVLKNMSLFAGGQLDRVGAPGPYGLVEPFLLDVTEVTVRDYRGVCGKTPTEWARGPVEADENAALAPVSFNQALVYAELVGKRLPTEYEYEFAATNGGTTRFPWGDDSTQIVPWRYGAVKMAQFDVTYGGSAPVYGLFSNVAEWTESILPPVPLSRPPVQLSAGGDQWIGDYAVQRVVCGGSPAVAEGAPTVNEADHDPRRTYGADPKVHKKGLGFRCARSAKPRFLD